MTCDRLIFSQDELIKVHGYIAETHKVWTDDNYRLNVHRVLHPDDRIPPVSLNDYDTKCTVANDSSENYNSSISPKSCHQVSKDPCTPASSKVPVLILHGLLSSSADWVLLGPHNALG